MRLLIAFGLALALAGSADAEGIKVVVPAPVVLQPLPPGAKTKPVSLTRIAANIAPGTPWEEDASSPYFMVPCVLPGDVSYWKEANNKVTAIATFDRLFRDELRAGGFNSGGDPTNLFEEQSASDLQVGALITGLQMKTCVYVSFINTSFQGSTAMDVEWQVYSVSQAKVLARITTHGGFVLQPTRERNAAPIVGGAFADNVRRLMADEKFREIVTASAGPPTAPLKTTLTYSASPARKMPLDAAAKGVVSIFAGDALGSGVLISADGYILTNHHVAGESGPVRIRWPDGHDTIGEVLRSDTRRDVALIKTTPNAAALAIRHTPVQLGETVFAIGTPLDKELAGTLTRGVVSSSRMIEGQSWIQSDVTVNHGNSGGPLLDEGGAVVGLTAWGMAPEGSPVGLNFFIPIDDALRALALKPAG